MTPETNGTEESSSKCRSTKNLICFLDDFQTLRLILEARAEPNNEIRKLTLSLMMRIKGGFSLCLGKASLTNEHPRKSNTFIYGHKITQPNLNIPLKSYLSDFTEFNITFSTNFILSLDFITLGTPKMEFIPKLLQNSYNEQFRSSF